MQTSELVKAAMAKASITSMRALARELDVSQSIVSLWANDMRVPEFEHAAALAEMAGLPAAKTAALLRLQTPTSRKVQAVLRRIATAACLTIGAIGALARPADVSAAQRSPNFLQEPTLSSLYIMRNLRRWVRRAKATGAQMFHLLKAKIQGAVGPLTPGGKATSAQVLCTC